MAAFPSMPIDKFIDQYPQIIREWIEQDLGWNIHDVKDIMIDPQMVTIGTQDKKYAFLQYIDVLVSRRVAEDFETKKHRFFQLPNGKWHKYREWIWIGGKDGSFLPVTDWEISYTSEYETRVEKEEMNDRDAFDLMDSIRDELWK